MSAREPWLSVIVPTYDGEAFIADALESVRAEAAEGVEVIVVDDGSRDRTLEIVRGFEGTLNLRVVPHAPARNWVATSNVGLRAAAGRYACFLHQDDRWLPGRARELQRALARHPLAHLMFHPAVFLDPDGRRAGRWGCPLRAGPVTGDELMTHLLVQNFIAVSSPIFDRRRALQTGGLDESLWYTADWDLWLRLGADGAVYVDRPLAGFRLHAGSQTIARARTDSEFLAQMTTVLERHLAAWGGAGPSRARVARLARFSAKVNVALSAMARGGDSRGIRTLLWEFLALGPRGWLGYLRDSRLVERVVPRFRLRLRADAPR